MAAMGKHSVRMRSRMRGKLKQRIIDNNKLIADQNADKVALVLVEKNRIHCDEEKKHREVYVAFHRKLFAEDPD